MMYIREPDGTVRKAADVFEWATKFENCRVIEQTHVGARLVSTVFLGLDHCFTGGPPLLWETMVFGGRHHEFQARYSLESAAREGHTAAVRMVQARTRKARRRNV